jgi:Fe2+ transport system protein FeoA
MVICPLCGFEFERVDTLCRHGCPLHTTCNLTRCPSCDYEFPAGAVRAPRWRLWPWRRQAAPAVEEVATVRSLGPGDRARVVALAGGDGARHNTLAVFGLVPGAEVELLQRRPTFVVRVGETELALEGEIAGQIVVAPCQASADCAAG